MALIKKIVLPSGHSCSYWRIIEISTKHLSNDGYVTVIGYRSKDTREGGMQPLSDSSKTFYGYQGHGGTEEAYEWLKGLMDDVPDAMTPNPDYDPEQAPHIMIQDEDGATIPQPNPDYQPQFLFIPAHKVPGCFADAKEG